MLETEATSLVHASLYSCRNTVSDSFQYRTHGVTVLLSGISFRGIQTVITTYLDEFISLVECTVHLYSVGEIFSSGPE